MAVYYKALTQDGRAPYERRTKYSLPTQFGRPRGVAKEDPRLWKPGLWHTTVGKLVMCRVGLHIATAKNIKHWAKAHSWNGSSIRRRVFAVEVPPGTERITERTKICVRTCRLTREVAYGSVEWLSLGLWAPSVGTNEVNR